MSSPFDWIYIRFKDCDHYKMVLLKNLDEKKAYCPACNEEQSVEKTAGSLQDVLR